MPHRTIKSLLVLALLLQPAVAGGQQAPTRESSGVLEGRWQVELFLDPRSMRSPPPAEKVAGEIAFGAESWWGNAERFGRYAVDLRPFFGRFFAAPGNVAAFSASDTSFLTEASGGVAGDSVVIDFMPRVDHLGLTFRGRFYGDSARGRWYRRGTEGYGPFVLRRVSKEPVAIAAIPDPAKQAAAAAQTATRGGRRTPARRTTTAKAPPKTPPKAAAKAPPKTEPAVTTTVATTVATTTAPKDTTKTPPRSGPANTPANTAANMAATTPATTPSTATGPATGPAARLASATVSGTAPGTAATPGTAGGGTPNAPVAGGGATPVVARPQGVLVAVTSSPLVPVARLRGDTTGTGALRVRIFDRASQRWFVTKYALKLPDGDWMLANLRTGAGADGWGTPIRRAPGRHEVEIGDFVCGDKIWFLRNKVTRAIEVKAGETTDVSVDVDLAAEAAKPSLDNKSGAKCAAPPGTPR